MTQRQVEIETLEIVLARSANFDAIHDSGGSDPIFFNSLRTHWKRFQITARFANFARKCVIQNGARDLTAADGSPKTADAPSSNVRSLVVFATRDDSALLFLETRGELFALSLQFLRNDVAERRKKFLVLDQLFLPLLVIDT